MTNIVKNVKFSLVTFISQILTGSIVFIILARVMSLFDFGLLSFGTTLGGLIAVLAEFGYSLMAQRDIPQNKFDLNEYVTNVVIQKLILSFISLIGGGLYLLLSYKDGNLIIGFIFLIYAIITSNVSYFLAVFRAKNLFILESKSSIIYLFFITISIACFFLFNLSVYYVSAGLLISRFMQLLVLLYNYVRNFGTVGLKFKKNIQNYLLKNVSSFGFFYIIGVFYFSIDSQLIAYYSGNEQLALYQAFFKLVTLMLVFNELLVNVFLPYLSSLFVEKGIHYLGVATNINRIFIFAALAMFVFINLFAGDIVSLVYTEKYAESLVLTIPLSLVLLFRVSSSTYAISLTISNHQTYRLLIVLISLIINLTLNLIFIPIYGFLGAAYVSLITHIVLLVLYGFFNYKFIGSLFIDWKALIITLITIIIVLLKYLMNINISILGSIMTMLLWIVFVCLNYYDKEQIKGFLKLFRAS